MLHAAELLQSAIDAGYESLYGDEDGIGIDGHAGMTTEEAVVQTQAVRDLIIELEGRAGITTMALERGARGILLCREPRKPRKPR